MVYDYILENYKANEPIFFSDIEIQGISRSAISQQLKKLCNNNKIIKYDNNVYYIPNESKLCKPSGINADMVARYKYISKKGEIDGFYSGALFANQVGISTQVPNKVEIVSNNTNVIVRDISIGGRIFTVRKSCVAVNKNNAHVLQLLDLLKNLDAYIDADYEMARVNIKKYIEAHQITKAMIDRYIRNFPVNVYKFYYEMRLDDVLHTK